MKGGISSRNTHKRLFCTLGLNCFHVNFKFIDIFKISCQRKNDLLQNQIMSFPSRRALDLLLCANIIVFANIKKKIRTKNKPQT